MTMTRTWVWIPLIAATFVVPLSIVVAAGDPTADEINRKPSTYAPAQDLESQIQFFLDRIKEDLEEESKYDESRIKRVTRDANTLAVLALVLGKHDEANRYQTSAVAILANALTLAGTTQKFGEAKAAYDRLVEATTVHEASAALTWKSVGDIAELMNQVPTLNTNLRGIVRSETRFDTSRDKAAGLAATLAAIAQVSVFDTSYCTDPADQAEWIELCGLMRDAAFEVNQAVRQGNQPAAVEGLKPFARTCDDCHEQFKD
ncbi:MAG: hypothetical protein ACYC6N_31005 [Pirellulaceae bacterium]